MKNIIYFRCKRSGSTKFYSVLNCLRDCNLIGEWWGKSHIPAPKLKQLCIDENSKKYWEDAVKIVSVRNPWIQQVSRFFLSVFKLTGKKIPYGCEIEPDLYKELIQLFRDHMRKPKDSISQDYYNRNWEMYTIDDIVIADVIIHLDDISKSIKNLSTSLKRNYKDVEMCFSDYISHGDSKYVKRYDYRDFYDAETKDLVYEMRKKEIDYFKYTFE